jgi:hypothetical protein
MSGDALWGTSNARFEAAQALPESLRDVVLLPLHRLTHGTYFPSLLIILFFPSA